MKNLQEACNKLGIKAILCDLDDTLIRTRDVFVDYMDLYCEVSSREIGEDFKTLRKNLQKANDNTFKAYGVRRSKWQIVIANLVNIYGEKTEEIFSRSLYILDEIYKVAPPLVDGAKEFLGEVNKNNLPICIVTHANVPWTLLKMDVHNFWEYSSHLHIVPEDGHKTKEEWIIGSRKVGAHPRETLAAGDSILSDMIPAYEAGIPYLFWINNKKAWSIYVNHDLPNKAVTINGIHEIIPSIIKLAA